MTRLWERNPHSHSWWNGRKMHKINKKKNNVWSSKFKLLMLSSINLIEWLKVQNNRFILDQLGIFKGMVFVSYYGAPCLSPPFPSIEDFVIWSWLIIKFPTSWLWPNALGGVLDQNVHFVMLINFLVYNT